MTQTIGRQIARPALESSDSQKPVSTPVFAENYPDLWSFLANQRDLGEIHKTGCLTIFVDGDRIKVCANDRPTRQSCFVSGLTLGECFARLDRGLVEGSLRWTKSGYRRRSAKVVNK